MARRRNFFTAVGYLEHAAHTCMLVEMMSTVRVEFIVCVHELPAPHQWKPWFQFDGNEAIFVLCMFFCLNCAVPPVCFRQCEYFTWSTDSAAPSSPPRGECNVAYDVPLRQLTNQNRSGNPPPNLIVHLRGKKKQRVWEKPFLQRGY